MTGFSGWRTVERRLEHLDDAIGGHGGPRDHRHHERDHHDGEQDLDEVAEVGDQRADLASGLLPTRSPPIQITATLDMLMISITVGNVAAMQAAGAQRGLGQLVVRLAEPLGLLRFAHERPHDPHAGDLLAQHEVDPVDPHLHRLERRHHPVHDRAEDDHRRRDRERAG